MSIFIEFPIVLVRTRLSRVWERGLRGCGFGSVRTLSRQRVAREEGQLSERRACGLIGMSRGSWRYRKKERDEAVLRKRLLELAAERPPLAIDACIECYGEKSGW